MKGRAWFGLAAGILCAVVACTRKEAPVGSHSESAPAAVTAPARPVPAAQSGLPYAARTLGAKKDDPLPWVVALHGLGDNPESFLGLLEGAPLRAHLYAPRALHRYGAGYDWFRVRVDGDPDELAAAMHTAVGELTAWLDARQRDPRNVGKPIVTGFSQGGMLSFALAVEHPDRFLAVIPISGTLPRPLWPATAPKKKVPIFALHGTEDRVIALGPTEALVSHLGKVGHEASLDRFPGVAHRIPGEVRQRLYELLVQALDQ